MGLDKLKVITPRKPQPTFFRFLNDDLQKKPEERHFQFQFRFDPGPTVFIEPTTRLTVYTKPRIEPFVRVELQFIAPGGKLPPLTTVETNPNNFPTGYAGVTSLLEIIFGEAFSDLKISRIDCNADVPGVSVEHIRRSIRIPRKRKSADVGRMHESYSNIGVQTFYVGKSPAQLRVYDKIQELKYQRLDTSKLPPVLTRMEWEFRERRCPVRFWGELPQMLDVEPFSGIEFFESHEHYSFRYFPRESFRLYGYNKLREDKGAHEAIRIINACYRHFSRDVREHLVENLNLKERIQAEYRTSTKAFFENRCADVRALYEGQGAGE